MVWTRSSADTSKNVWILHGGVPILTAEDMVRPASSEEYLEKELLGTEGQEARGLLYEEVRGPDNLDLEFNQHTWTTSRREQDQQTEDSSKEGMKMKMDRERG